ncbi:uncharacterized protein LOC123717159 [Pieris brassicae]|uniref:Single domain-containing protein n=1 Tax=Pieris brassicae TaxID=7116 RepID=A0A9P0XH64_PIEBR|nr:uncharacterized protein LOC123717159 [Pieris brassicae]CAH4036291.1 unnamed protein product [Pieris brassicae]
MKYFIVLAVFALAFAAEEKKEDDDSKTFKRLIPADVLRDFPGLCFASTRCATVEPGNSWDLAPFCGRSSCVISEDEPPRLLELVEDCGPLPLANPKCKLDTEKTNKTAPFPGCCPQFTCEDGVKLEYPELPTPPPEEKKDEKKSA